MDLVGYTVSISIKSEYYDANVVTIAIVTKISRSFFHFVSIHINLLSKLYTLISFDVTS